MTTTPPQRLRPDAVERQLKRLASQGGHMARLAHLCAFLLIILFSAGSLVSLSGEALASILRQWQSGGALDIPAAISVAVSTLLVLAMDVAMIYAASVLRMLTARHAPASEQRQHQAVMAAVAILEAATYGYMSALYDHPASLAAWALILARAGAAPFLAVYLSMARPLPIERRDILHAAALAAGAGVLRDVTQLANDADAPLTHKVRLYQAADYQPGRDDEQLDRMIAALADHATGASPISTQPSTSASASEAAGDVPARTSEAAQPQDGAPVMMTQASAPAPVQAAVDAPVAQVRTPDDDAPPTGPGSPITAPSTRRQRRNSQPAILRLEPDRPRRRGDRRAAQAGVRTSGGNESLEAVARQAWATGATSIPKMRKATGMGQSAAQSWVRTLKAEAAATTGAPNAGQRVMPAPTLPGMAAPDGADASEGYAL